MIIGLTEPVTIGSDSSIGKILGLKRVEYDFPLTIANGFGFVHLETANFGGGTEFGLIGIAAVDVERVLWFSGDVNVSLLLLRHCRD